MGLAPGTLVPLNATSTSLAIAGGSSSRGLTLSEDLYRGMDTLAYGDHKADEDAIDRVTSKINKECVLSPARRGMGLMDSLSKPKRKQKDDEDGEITYINDRNKVFNKKVRLLT